MGEEKNKEGVIRQLNRLSLTDSRLWIWLAIGLEVGLEIWSG